MRRYLKPIIALVVLITITFEVDSLARHSGRTTKTVRAVLNQVDSRMVKEFRRAWRISRNGSSFIEGLVLIFRMPDGSCQAELQDQTNQFKSVSFTFKPDVAAIVHTHPNGSDPRPSDADREVADVCGIPIFTITSEGMFVYDPATRETSKVMDRLDWLKPSSWAEKAYEIMES